MIVNYLSKKNRNISLLSGDFRRTDESTPKFKPHVIMEYNKTKGGVDAVNKMAQHFSTKMASRQWTFAVLCNISDIEIYSLARNQ